VLPSAEAVALIGADLAKSLEAVAMIATPPSRSPRASTRSATSPARSVSFAWIAQDVCMGGAMERDGSTLPQQAVNLVNALKAFLIALVEEEVAEMLAAHPGRDRGDVIALVLVAAGDVVVMELANKIVDLVKADTA
jgi:hypothetical protein